MLGRNEGFKGGTEIEMKGECERRWVRGKMSDEREKGSKRRNGRKNENQHVEFKVFKRPVKGVGYQAERAKTIWGSCGELEKI
jgi:hypothetical protein